MVGTHLLYDLSKSGKKIRVLKRVNSNIANIEKVFSYYTPDPGALLRNIEWVDADLLDVHSLTDAMEGITEVYHCAAMVSFVPKDEHAMMKINAEGTANMVNAAIRKSIKKFCHVSSIATIGRSEHVEILNEDLFWKLSPDHSNYAISKYSAEREVWRASEEGLDVVIVNPSLIIGAGNWEQSSANLFTKGYRGIKFYTEGINGFVDVRDVSSLMIALMESPVKNERFILNSENIPYRRFFDLVHKEFGKPASAIKAGKLLSHVAWRLDKIRSLLTGNPPFITRETAISVHAKSLFSNEKIQRIFPEFKFISVEQAIQHTCSLFLKEKVAKS